MAVIIGNSTTVSIGLASEGILSIEWSFGTSPNRLYTLGMGQGTCGPQEFGTIRSSQVSVSFSLYGGSSEAVSTCAAETCANSPASCIVSVNPAVCGTTQVDNFNRRIFINSYSYSKERTGFGTEQWAGTAYVADLAATGCQNEWVEPEPTYVVLGVAEGQIEGDEDDLQAVVGAKFRDDACIVKSTRAQVQASQISLGEYAITKHGTIKEIGNSQFWNPGVSAKAQVTLNLQPVYI